MSLAHWLVVVGAIGFVLWAGRRIPLAGWRKRFVIGCRLATVGCLGTALFGASCHRTQEIARSILYLADGSASIDAGQRAWIARRIASLEQVRPAPLRRAVMVFGQDASVVVPPGRQPLTDAEAIRAALEAAAIDRSQTNLETALLSASSVLPPPHRGGVVLLSDGRETAGNVTGVLASVRRMGLAVFPAAPPTGGEVKTVWEDLVAPPVVQQGSAAAIQMIVFNGSERLKQGRVTVQLHGVAITRKPLAVRPGWQVFSLSVPAIGRGTMALDVHLEIPEEGLTERRAAFTEVEGPPRLWLIGDRLTTLPLLAAALKRREIDVAVGRASDLPTDPAALLDSDAVMLFNVPKSSITAAQAAALTRYVEDLGGGLVMVGLGGDLAQEIDTPAPIDPLLPVTFEPKGLQEAKRRVCMILLVDRSASMLGPRIAATKRAAVELVNQLAPEDLLGILAFDTQPYVVAEVQPSRQIGPWLVEKLVQLRSSGGTDVLPALAAASNRLDMTDATVKHVILLSDGNTPFPRDAYQRLAEAFRRDGITVSTIGIGAAFVNTDYLTWLAGATGGTFYQMKHLDELPRLVAEDTKQALGRLPFAEGYFRPTRAPAADWFPETADWPPLSGYLTATAKPGAGVELIVQGEEEPSPLLVRWMAGHGRVVSFTSDADARWSPQWIRWPGFDATWAKIVRWAMRPEPTEELFVWVDESRGVSRLMVEGVLHDPQGSLAAATPVPAESAASSAAQPAPANRRGPPADSGVAPPIGKALALVQTGTWRWEASLADVPSGWHQLTLESRMPEEGAEAGGIPLAQAAEAGGSPLAARGAPIVVKRWVQVGIPPTADETTGQPPRESLLRQIARATSGVYDAPDRALVPPTTTTTTTEPLLTWWLPLAMLLLLVEIAARGSSML